MVKTLLSVRKVWAGVYRALGRSSRTQCRKQLATAAMFFELRSCFALALSCVDGPHYSLVASAKYREYNESLILSFFCYR